MPTDSSDQGRRAASRRLAVPTPDDHIVEISDAPPAVPRERRRKRAPEPVSRRGDLQPTAPDPPARRPLVLVAAVVAALGLLVLLAVVSRL
ncbi:MAG: hypothetical protein IT373_10395 [Polyangiaceae bacterium]|nr:hypothetical protein [Polyangiaceae bacterium]